MKVGQLRAQRRADGLCIDCAVPTPPVPGKGRCAFHVAKRAKYMRGYHAAHPRGKRPPRPPRPMPLCACGCGLPCKTRKARYASRACFFSQRPPTWKLGPGKASARIHASLSCYCAKCEAIRAAGRQARVALIARVAAEKGVSVSHPPVAVQAEVSLGEFVGWHDRQRDGRKRQQTRVYLED